MVISPPSVRSAVLALARRLFLGVFLGLLLGLLPACSAGTNYLRRDLANIGPQFLSDENPFVATNLFVARERDASPLVDKFLQHQGEPDAVEIRTKLLRPFRMYFFYLDTQVAYLFEEREANWIIRGPERIPEQILTNLLAQRPRRTHPRHPTPSVDAPEPTALEPAVTLEEDLEIQQLPPTTTLQPPPANAGSVSQTVPADNSGDLLHTVTFPGETMRMIAAWFTGNADNAGRIARINGIENPDLLFLGQNIRIPRYLLKRSQPFPKSEVDRYLNSLAQPKQ